MSDIRKRTGAKGTTYQVRYPSKAAKSGYAYATFATRKEARAFTENLGGLREAPSDTILQVNEAVDRWVSICEKIGRDGRETVEPKTLKEYRRRAKVMKEYRWPKRLHELERRYCPFPQLASESKTRDLARRTLSSFHSVLIEMKHQGYTRDDIATGITISSGRYEEEKSVIEIPSEQEIRDMLGAADRPEQEEQQFQKCWERYRPMIYLARIRVCDRKSIAGYPGAVFLKVILVRHRRRRIRDLGPVKSKAGRRTICCRVW